MQQFTCTTGDHSFVFEDGVLLVWTSSLNLADSVPLHFM